MSKSVYSVVLMDDVVDAVDRLAYEAGTNRSNMINRILAEYVQLATPEQRMQDIFSSIMDAVSGCCFSKRMRKLFRKNEKSVLRFCNKSSKTKRAFTKVLMPCKRPF